mgnify:FL=1
MTTDQLQKYRTVNLEAELGVTVRPDPEHVCLVNGRQWFEFEASYTDTESGRPFSFSFWALSFDDARRRIECMRDTVTVTGQIYGTYPDNGLAEQLMQGNKK